MSEKKVGTFEGYNIYLSSRKDKKYYAMVNGKRVYFGAIKPNGEPYAQYKDQMGYYSKYDHNDESRRKRYHARHSKNYEKGTADYLSKKILW